MEATTSTAGSSSSSRRGSTTMLHKMRPSPYRIPVKFTSRLSMESTPIKDTETPGVNTDSKIGPGNANEVFPTAHTVAPTTATTENVDPEAPGAEVKTDKIDYTVSGGEAMSSTADDHPATASTASTTVHATGVTPSPSTPSPVLNSESIHTSDTTDTSISEQRQTLASTYRLVNPEDEKNIKAHLLNLSGGGSGRRMKTLIAIPTPEPTSSGHCSTTQMQVAQKDTQRAGSRTGVDGSGANLNGLSEVEAVPKFRPSKRKGMAYNISMMTFGVGSGSSPPSSASSSGSGSGSKSASSSSFNNRLDSISTVNAIQLTQITSSSSPSTPKTKAKPMEDPYQLILRGCLDGRWKGEGNYRSLKVWPGKNG
jgi:hypothetical protein